MFVYKWQLYIFVEHKRGKTVNSYQDNFKSYEQQQS